MIGSHILTETRELIALLAVTISAAGLVWGVGRRVHRVMERNHAKLDALEQLITTEGGPITTGALAALQRIERRLVVTSAQVRLVVEEDGRGYVETNEDGLLTHVNATWMRWTDMTLEQAKGRGWVMSIAPEDRERLRKEWGEAIRDQRAGEFVYSYVDANGKRTPVHARSTVVRDDHSGEVLGFIALISERPAT